MQCQPPEIESHAKLGPAAAGADADVWKGLGGCSRLGTQTPRGFSMQKEAAMNSHYDSNAPYACSFPGNLTTGHVGKKVMQ